MALIRPTLTELVARIQADLVSRLELTGPVRRRSIIYVLARVLAGAVHMLYGAIEYLSHQLFADQSDSDYLEREASCYGMSRLAPTFATATITVTGSAGATVPAGALLQDAGGYEWAVDVGGTIPGGGSMALAVTAVAFGADASTRVGAQLTFESPYAGVLALANVTVCVDGAARESVEDFRTRFLERKASRGGNGGSVADYVAWAKEIAGVTRVWPVGQGAGPGTVLVYFVRDHDASPIPDAGEVAAVQTHLDTVKPASCALVQVMAPVDGTQDLGIHISPDTPALRQAVTAELDAMFLRRMSPAAAGILRLSWLQTAVGSTSGVDNFTITYPADDAPFDQGTLVRRGGITWVP